MEITPYIKALSDDILQIIKTLVAKRPDLANVDEDNDLLNIEIFNAYKEILAGEDTISSYGILPLEIVKNLTTWIKIPRNDMFLPPKADSFGQHETAEGEARQYYGYVVPTFVATPGDLYVQKVANERYAKVYAVNKSNLDFIYIFNLSIHGDYINNIPKYNYRDPNTNEIVYPYVNYRYIHCDDTSEGNMTDEYGNEYVINQYKYVYDDATGEYIRTTNTTDYYNICYSYGFYKPSVSNDYIYVTKEEFDDNPEKYTDTSEIIYVFDGTDYIPVNDIPESDYDKYPEIYYKCKLITYSAMDNALYDYGTASFKVVSHNTSSSIAYYYYASDIYGSYVYDGNDYVLDTENISSKRYSKVVIDSPKDRFSYDGTAYIVDPSGDYIFVCDDCEYWICQKAVPDDKLGSVTNIAHLEPQFRESAMNAMREYILSTYCPNRDSPDFSVPIYYGETNTYYRKLNGLPPISRMSSAPKVDRYLINPTYDGDNPNPYIYELTDSEIRVLKESGRFSELRARYLNEEYDYLDYLGEDRIDVIIARDAYPFDILRMGDIENSYHKDIFIKSYTSSRDYVLNRYYYPEIFHEFDHYVSYLGFIIMSIALQQCLTKSSEIYTYDKYMDEDTINDILESHGFKGRFKSLSLIHKKMIAKNILLLLKYRGTDLIYKIIYNICNITDFDVFKYDIINGDELSIVKKSVISQEYVNSDINFDELIANDELWQASKDTIKSLGFSRSATKYIDINTYFDLNEITLNNSFFLNYLLDISKNKDLEIDIPTLGIYKLYDLIVMLFACQMIKLGYSGLIPTSAETALAVSKFNLDEVKGGHEKCKEIINRYRYILSGESLADIDNLLSMIESKNTVYVPSTDDNTIRSFSDLYFKSLQEKSPNMNLNQNSFYRELIRLKNSTSDLNEYKCCVELIECIATGYITSKNFALDTPIWEPIFTGVYGGSLASYNKNDYISSTWLYGTDLSLTMPDIINTSRYGNEAYVDELVVGKVIKITGSSFSYEYDDYCDPLFDNYHLRIVQDETDATKYNVTLYKKCYYAMTYSMYIREQVRELYDKLYEITIKDKYIIDAYDTMYSVNSSLIKVSKDGDKLIIDLGDSTNYTLIDTDTDGDIDIIQLKDGTSMTYEEYYALLKSNADRIYKLIISKLESMVNMNQNRKNLIFSHESTENVMDAIELLIETFKAYNIDIRENKIVYKYDASNDNNLRIFDNLEFSITTEKSDSISFREELLFNFN